MCYFLRTRKISPSSGMIFFRYSFQKFPNLRQNLKLAVFTKFVLLFAKYPNNIIRKNPINAHCFFITTNFIKIWGSDFGRKKIYSANNAEFQMVQRQLLYDYFKNVAMELNHYFPSLKIQIHDFLLAVTNDQLVIFCEYFCLK